VTTQRTHIPRGKTAISRGKLSRPARLALEAGVVAPGSTFFDYGCGRGEDVELLSAVGVDSSGWDPHWAPSEPLAPADVVGLSYVLNVIEDEPERSETLRAAWALATKALIVGVQPSVADTGRHKKPHGDGIITGLGTFQKYYTQAEAKLYLDSELGVATRAAGLGVFFAFRDEGDALAFEATRFHRRVRAGALLGAQALEGADLRPSRRKKLEVIAGFVREHGRLPAKGEDAACDAASRALGGWRKAERLVLGAIGEEALASRAAAVREDLLLFFALSKFRQSEPKAQDLPEALSRDVRAHLGGLGKARGAASELLFSIGRDGAISGACARASFGKSLPDGLYVHADYIGELPVELRLMEGLASAYVGRVDGATLVKFHTDRPAVSYLFYEDFEAVAHPRLERSVRASLGRLEVESTDFSRRPSRPLLHRKELFVPDHHPTRPKFEALTSEEEAAGLFEEARRIGTERGWREAQIKCEVDIVGHEVRPWGSGNE